MVRELGDIVRDLIERGSLLDQDSQSDARLKAFITAFDNTTPDMVFNRELACSIPGLWDSVDNMQSRARAMVLVICYYPTHSAHSKLQFINTCVQRQQIMLSYGFAWSWLDCRCMPHARNILLQGPSTSSVRASIDKSDWLGALALDIKLRAQSRVRSPLYAREYLSGLPGDLTFQLPDLFPYLTSEAELNERVLLMLYGTLSTWLGYPVGHGHAKGMFAYRLCSLVHSHDILLLPEVWDAFSNVNTRVCGGALSRRNTSKYADHMDSFFRRMATTPIVDVTSEEFRLLTQIGSLVRRVFQVVPALSEAGVRSGELSLLMLFL